MRSNVIDRGYGFASHAVYIPDGMGAWPDLVLPALLVLLLLWAAWGDIRTRTIPNWLNAAIALLAPLWWWASGMAVWPDMAIQFGLALGLFALFAAAFAIGAMGGGDVKLIAAVALWLPLAALVDMLLLMAIAGGALTVVMMILHRWRRAEARPEIPYGVAISLASIWVVANQNLTSSVH